MFRGARERTEREAAMQEIKIRVEGMHCGMCESHVNDVVRNVKGVKKVKSSHSKGQTVVIAEDDVDIQAIAGAISAQGYGVGGTESKRYEKHGLWRK